MSTISPLDFVPPPILTKGWHLISDDIERDRNRAIIYKEEFCKWLDSQCGTIWRSKIVLIDLVLPNALEDFRTVTGLLIGRQYVEQESSVLDRYDKCVIELTRLRRSVGLNAVFLKGIPILKGQNYPATSKAEMTEVLKNHNVDELIGQHLLYSSIPQDDSSSRVEVGDKMIDFELRSIGYKAVGQEQHDPLGGKDEDQIEDNLKIFTDLVRNSLPEVKAFAAIPLATPFLPDDVSGEFQRIGQIFICFSIDARSGAAEGKWDPDCAALMRALITITAFSNASHAGIQLRLTKDRQVQSHELGEIFVALRSKIILPQPSTRAGELNRLKKPNLLKEAIVFQPLWEAAINQFEIWMTSLDGGVEILSLPCFGGCLNLEDLIRACWEHIVDYQAIHHFKTCFPRKSEDNQLLNFCSKLDNWRSRCCNALKIESQRGLHLLPLEGDSEIRREKVALIRGFCAVMRDILKHASEDLCGSATTEWRINFNEEGDTHSSPHHHRVLTIQQINSTSKPFSESIGRTKQIVTNFLAHGHKFNRVNDKRDDGNLIHRDEWSITQGAIHKTLTTGS